jgi:hypothetical protein
MAASVCHRPRGVRLIESPPSTVDAFTDDVLRAEGLDPMLVEKGLRRVVRGCVAKWFEQGSQSG